MKLSELLSAAGAPLSAGAPDPDIRGISEDSRAVGAGFLFFARKGAKTSGMQFVQDAVSRGAAAVVSDEEIPGLPRGVAFARVASIPQAQTEIARKFYGNPSRDLPVVGVTGTNGKTTFTFMMDAIGRQMGWRTGIVGTIHYQVPTSSGPPELLPAPNTTPNALELQKLLHLMRERKTDLVVMEVSSHALALGRTDGIEFDGAVFTNLTQDHLDFHHTMEAYFEAKSKLFTSLSPGSKPAPASTEKPAPRRDKFCIINLDDPHGKKLAGMAAAPVTSYALQKPADCSAKDVQLCADGTHFTLALGGRETPIRSKLVGKHNVYNSLAAAGAAFRLGVPLDRIARGLESVESVPGRLEAVRCGQPYTVLVDYAHTEDALRNVLEAVAPFKRNRVITVFGCGGDRDRSKRPLMGACAMQLSDWVIVTSDNPRSEDPQKIALDIEVGIHRTGKTHYEVILDRELAIRQALQKAEKDDILLIAGKGHENYQIFADRTIHFDDREVVRKVLCKP